MNFLQVRNNIAHMIHEDPLGIDHPPINDPEEETHSINHSSVDLTKIDGVRLKWFDDHVKMYDSKRDVSFSISYEDRSEGQIAAEVVKIIDYLRS